jgi:hypothetical protein
MKILRCAIALSFMLLFGCAYNVKLDPDIEPAASISNPINLHTGLYIPEEISTLRVSDRTEGDSYAFNVGEALESLIIKSAARVFTHIEVLEEYPTEEIINEYDLDLVAIVKVTSAKVSLDKDTGFFQDNAKGNTQISTQMTFYNGEMSQVAAVMATGMGVGSEKIGVFSDGKSEYSVSVENALRNLGDDLVHNIYGNYDIRKRAESKP